MEPSYICIRADSDEEEFRRRLERSWEVGYVADLSLTDGTVISASLIAVSSTALILDHWDKPSGASAGDPFTLELHSVGKVLIY